MNSTSKERMTNYSNWLSVFVALDVNLEHLFKMNVALNNTQTCILLLIAIYEDGITMGEISKKLALTPNATSAAASTLQKRGYIKRTRSKSDNRVVYATVTKEGLALIPKIRESFEAHYERVAQVITKDEWIAAEKTVVAFDMPLKIHFFEEPLAYDVGGYFVIRNILSKFTRFVRMHDLHLPEARILIQVFCSEEITSLAELSKLLYMQNNVVTFYVNSLVSSKLLQKEQSATDKRAVALSLTKAGEELVGTLYNKADAYIEENDLIFTRKPAKGLLEYAYMVDYSTRSNK